MSSVYGCRCVRPREALTDERMEAPRSQPSAISLVVNSPACGWYEWSMSREV